MANSGSLLLTLAIGFVGAVIGYGLSFPAPWLTGPALCVTIAALAGLKLNLPVLLRNTCFVFLGMTIGATVTPEMVAHASQWPLSIAILFIAMLAIMGLGAVLLEKGFGYNRVTSVLAASPGHLSFVLGVSAQVKGADVAAISVIQSLRVLALTLAVPFLAMLLASNSLGDVLPEGAPMTYPAVFLTASTAWLAAFLLARLHLPAAYLLGGMLASSLGHLTGFLPGQVPVWLAVPAFVLMGTLIGTRFSGVPLSDLKRALVAALSFTSLSALIALIAGLVGAYFLDIPLLQLLVAYAPGGLEAMAAMALLLGVNPTFVAAHHVARLLMLTFIVPLALRPIKHSNSQGSHE